MANQSTPTAPKTENAAIQNARERWMKRLMDVSRNNNLLYYRPLKTGTLALSEPDPATLKEFLAGNKVPLSKLLPNLAETELRQRASAIRKRALANLEEKGLATLYVALGKATWPVTDGGRAPEAVVILLPAQIEARGQTFALIRTGGPQINLALLHVLETEFDCTLLAEALLNPTVIAAQPNGNSPPDDEEAIFDPDVVLERLRLATHLLKGFMVREDAVLCNFSFQKMAMLRDIRDYGEQIETHPLLAAIAGDPVARESLLRARDDVALHDLDRISPDQEFLVLDADSSQQRVVANVARLQDGVIQGPPGTGKSQTIVNLIATLVAQGKRVLFVAEKRAALQVVQQRLERIGLGYLALDLHGADLSSRQVMTRIQESLTTVGESLPVAAADVHARFQDRRVRLNKHVAALHQKRMPLNLSAYDLQGHLLRLPAHAQTIVRWRGAELTRFTSEQVRHIKDLLSEVGSMEALFLLTDASPWTETNLRTGDDAQTALDIVNGLAHRHLPELARSLDALCRQTQLKRPDNAHEATELNALLADNARLLEHYRPEVYAEPVAAWAAAVQGASGGVKRFFARLTNVSYRNAVKALLSYRKTFAKEDVLHSEVQALTDVAMRWQRLAAGPSKPQAVTDQTELRDCVNSFRQLTLLQPLLQTDPLEALPLTQLQDMASALSADSVTPFRLPRLHELERDLHEAGLDVLIREWRKGNVPSAQWADALDYALYTSMLEQTRSAAPELATFLGRTHEGYVNEFQAVDAERTRLSVARVRRAHAEHALAARNTYKEQNQLVKQQVEKKRGRLPLRELLARAPNVLTALFPCWMASPLSISQLLKADQRYFDIVLFDEASQVLPEDAVPAIMRAEHVVVAGDRYQLPPTAFFAAGASEAEDDEAETATDGYESLLDVMRAFSETWSLDWHYRSKDEALIAFSNRHIYSNRLITFPGNSDDHAINHILAAPPEAHDGDSSAGDSTAAEVQRVVTLVFEHARMRPDETLGVITMGITHADKLEKAIEDELRVHLELEPFFDAQQPERFFVKSLERVQGDERDAIIISVGYGKDANGRLPYRFGPLLTQGGERRLNVAVTRARRRLTLVSSFDHHDMDPNRSNARGVELLRLYLAFAASHGRNVGETQGSSAVPLNPFEEDVRDALTARGIPLIPQWGVSSYRIDFAAQHRDKPGQLVLAIECDGATYHSAPTARDRDRLRQQVLESLGWRFHRIWSTDWFTRREEEIERAVAAYEAALTVTPNSPSEPVSSVAEMTHGQDFEKSIPLPVLSRSKRPLIADKASIDQYSDAELIGLLVWIKSDERLRDADQLFDALFDELPFKSRGKKIVTRLHDVIARTSK